MPYSQIIKVAITFFDAIGENKIAQKFQNLQYFNPLYMGHPAI